MSLATALKGAVADARPLQNPDFRRLWVTQIITMIGAQQLCTILAAPKDFTVYESPVSAAAATPGRRRGIALSPPARSCHRGQPV